MEYTVVANPSHVINVVKITHNQGQLTTYSNSHKGPTIQQSNHSTIQPFKCTECGRGFNQQAHLTSHMLTHTQELPFICEGIRVDKLLIWRHTCVCHHLLMTTRRSITITITRRCLPHTRTKGVDGPPTTCNDPGPCWNGENITHWNKNHLEISGSWSTTCNSSRSGWNRENIDCPFYFRAFNFRASNFLNFATQQTYYVGIVDLALLAFTIYFLFLKYHHLIISCTTYLSRKFYCSGTIPDIGENGQTNLYW